MERGEPGWLIQTVMKQLLRQEKWNVKKKKTHVRLARGVEDLEVDHVIVHDSVECVHLLQSGVVLPDKPAGDETHHQRWKIPHHPHQTTSYNWVYR